VFRPLVKFAPFGPTARIGVQWPDGQTNWKYSFVNDRYQRPAGQFEAITRQMLMAGTQPLGVYKKLITERLPVCYPTVDYTAHQVGIPVRTLQRRLRENGLSYSELVEKTRCELACRLLDKPGAKAADVARALGYTDPSSFSRAFRRWTGMSPRAYRNRN
jgi:AraC-like DNA-binding protein